ncbi:MAG: hypothetical protein WDZ83_15880 [Rhizobiaceae bacterium]
MQEFFFQAGDWLGKAAAQLAYIAANYTHALHFLMTRRPNVIAQLLARDGERLILSCNTDVGLPLRRRGSCAKPPVRPLDSAKHAAGRQRTRQNDPVRITVRSSDAWLSRQACVG